MTVPLETTVQRAFKKKTMCEMRVDKRGWTEIHI